jgi:hypothetical protein
MRSIPFTLILAAAALIFGLTAILDVVKDETALSLGIICLALAILIPGRR